MTATPQTRPYEPDGYDELAILLEDAQGLISALTLLQEEFGLHLRGPAADAFAGITAAASLFITEADDQRRRLQEAYRATQTPMTQTPEERNA